MRLNWLDRAIGFLSPSTAVRRARNRYALDVLERHGARGAYEGASKGRRTKGWRAPSSSANAETRGQLYTLRDRARDMVRNNAHANRGIGVIEANTIGTGIIPKVTSPSPARTARLRSLIVQWMGTTACDADGRHDFYGLQGLAWRTVVEAGEVLIRRRRRRASDGLPVPIQLQVLEPDFLDSTKDGPLPNGGAIYQGVEVDALGKRVAYWLFDDHPGDGTRMRSVVSRRIPAAEILHIFRTDRPGQMRGVPWLAPAMIKLRDFADYEDAQQVRQKIAACFTVFVHDMEMPDNPETGKQGEPLEQVAPGIIEHLPPGKDVSFANPPGVEGYSEYRRAQLSDVAMALGITYESISGDLSNVSFISGRLGRIDMYTNVEVWRWRTVVPQLCDPVMSWFLEAAFLVGEEVDGVETRWTAPRREMISPAEEVRAIRDAIRAGLISLPEAQRQAGEDPDEMLDEMAESARQLDDRGLVLDSDPRKVSAAGLTQARPDGSTLPPTS